MGENREQRLDLSISNWTNTVKVLLYAWVCAGNTSDTEKQEAPVLPLEMGILPGKMTSDGNTSASLWGRAFYCVWQMEGEGVLEWV